MERKETSFLSDPEWMNSPWDSMPKGPFDRLVDLILKALDLGKRGDRISKEPPEIQLTMGDVLLRDCRELDREIETFYESLKEEVQGPLYWPIWPNGDKTQGVPVRYEFANITIAGTVIMKWALSLMLHSGLCWLSALLDYLKQQNRQAEDNVPIRAFELSQRSGFITMARDILLSVEYCIRDVRGGVRPTAIMAPLGIVVDVLRDWPPYQSEYQSARQALQHISKLGFRMVWPPHGE